MRIVINRCHGGFSLSAKGIASYLQLKGQQCFFYKKNIAEDCLEQISVEKADIFFDKAVTKDYGIRLADKEAINKSDIFKDDLIARDDLHLIEVVDTLGSSIASGPMSELKVVTIPDDVKWYIHAYDGMETIHEVHRSWS